MSKIEITLTVNGEQHTDEVEPRLLLVQYLRDVRRLTGSHIGCDTSNCGACTVILDGDAVKSCTVLAVQARGGEVTTVEGLIGPGEPFTPVQQGFHQEHGLQCGYCTPGMLMTVLDLIRKRPLENDAEIRDGLSGNLCRCTGYQNIVKAAREAATVMRSAKAPKT